MCVPGACLCGRTWGRVVVPGNAWSYLGACGRTWGRAVVPGNARSYLKSLLRYDRVESRTTACGRGTTARFYIRPGEIAYDRAGPWRTMSKRCALPGAAGSAGQRCTGRLRAAVSMQCWAAQRRAPPVQIGAGPRWRRSAQGRVGTDQRRAPQAGVVTPISTGWNAVVTPPPSLEARSHHGNLSRAAPAPARRHLTRPADVHGSSGQASAWALRRSPLLRCAPVGSGALAQPGPLRRRLPGSHLGALSQS